MAASPQAASQVVDHGFHEVRVREVVQETADTTSYVLEVPADFAYRAGQFVTFRFRLDGATHLRSYSMSSCPGVEADFKVTVKRVPGGIVSNLMNDTLSAGDMVEVTKPAGVFVLPPGEADVVAFAGGSGITPVISIAKEALATTPRKVRLLYANRDRDSIIFERDLAALGVDVTHHLDVDDGFVTPEVVREYIAPDADYFICGPGPFMDIVEDTLLDAGVDAARVHIERFTPATSVPVDAPADGTRVTIELGGRTAAGDHYPGTTILQTARQLGLDPPYSCESGTCATCMAKLVEGEVRMRANNALTDDEVADGYILTCQSLPTTPTVHVVYEEW